jgi:hypothetical protein
MSRTAVLAAALAVTFAAACSKPAGSKDKGPGPVAPGTPEVIAAPGESKGAPVDTESQKLKPDEGQLSIEVPADAVAGQETTARVVVTPTPKYKINFEYPTSLTIEPPAEVTVAKAAFKAGGASKAQGDAEKFEEKQLAFAVKLTPAKSGSHTINGTFKFAVCDKDACLAKKEAIAIQLAAK